MSISQKTSESLSTNDNIPSGSSQQTQQNQSHSNQSHSHQEQVNQEQSKQEQIHTMPTKRKAIVLLSGGLDSSTILAIAKTQEFEVYALTFRYGQRHEAELQAAQRMAQAWDVKQHIIAEINLGVFGGSALTDENLAVPKGRSLDEMSADIPITYVPARNTIFLSFALAWAETLEAQDIFIGVNALDYSGYPDCRPEFIQAYENMANLATKTATQEQKRIKIHTPLIDLNKAQIVAKGIELGVDFSQTITCYDVDEHGVACGYCDACLLRLKGFQANGLQDPAPYAQS